MENLEENEKKETACLEMATSIDLDSLVGLPEFEMESSLLAKTPGANAKPFGEPFDPPVRVDSLKREKSFLTPQRTSIRKKSTWLFTKDAK